MRTALCDLLGSRYPILQAGMGRVAGPQLVAEICRAGGFGILAGLGLPPDELRRQIHAVRARTDAPFGVNLWMHEQLLPPVDPTTVPQTTIHRVQTTLNTFRRRLGLHERLDAPPPFPDTIGAAVDVVIAERVAVLSIALGKPTRDLVDRCHRAGVLVMPMVTTVEDARAIADTGADIIVAQGGEAGGHRSTWTKRDSPNAGLVGTFALVPQIADAVRQPVVAAGAIADGRGLVAALALGAQGALLGTRFVATEESLAPPMYKARVLAARSEDTAVTDAFTGLYARTLRNRFAAEYESADSPVLPALLQANAAEDIYAAAAKAEDPEHFPMPAGQSVGLIRDLPRAGDVVRSIVAEGEETLRRLQEA